MAGRRASHALPGPPGRASAGRWERRGGPNLHSLAAWQYLVQHGYIEVTSYQPASRFWAFQWIEAGWLLALSVVLIAITVWMVRRRVT